jgi:hypothetical protein
LAGGWLLSAWDQVRRLTAFSLITLAVLARRYAGASVVIRPLICHHIALAGIRLLPITSVIAVAMGWAIIGQTWRC